MSETSRVTRESLLRHLDDEDFFILYSLFKTVYKGEHQLEKIDDIKRFFQNISKKQLYQFAHLVMGWGIIRNLNPREVLDNLEKFKASLSNYKPWFQDRILASNSLIGEVSIASHALNRFWQYTKPNFDFRLPSHDVTEQIVDDFRKIFRTAEEVNLSKRHMVARKLNNEYESARYFLNKEKNLRFVVIESKSLLVTVEVPYEN